MRSKNRFVHNSVLFVACCLVLLGFSREARAFNCSTRHFYNQSSVPFQISFFGGSCSIGTFTGSSCTIPPGQTADLHYANFPESTTAIVISGGTIYRSHTFQVGGDCYIRHDDESNTGNIVVNDPADGDVVTCGRDYACS